MKNFYRGLLLTGMLGILLLSLVGCNDSSSLKQETNLNPQNLLVSDYAPKPFKDFTAKNSKTGKPVSLSSFKGKKVVLVFWFSTCGPCLADLPTIEKLHKKNLKNVAVVTVGHADTPAELNKVANKYTFLALFNEKWKISDLYGVTGFPTHVFLNAKGEECQRTSGCGDPIEKFISILNKIK